MKNSQFTIILAFILMILTLESARAAPPLLGANPFDIFTGFDPTLAGEPQGRMYTFAEDIYLIKYVPLPNPSIIVQSSLLNLPVIHLPLDSNFKIESINLLDPQKLPEVLRLLAQVPGINSLSEEIDRQKTLPNRGKLKILHAFPRPSFVGPCPSTDQDWNHWIHEKITSIATNTSGRLSDPSKIPRTYNPLKYLACLAEMPTYHPDCGQNLRTFASNFIKKGMNVQQHRMNLEISDEEYFRKATPYTHELPVQFSQPEFLKAMRAISRENPSSAAPLKGLLLKLNESKPVDRKWHFISLERMPQITGSQDSMGFFYIPAADLPKPSRDLFILFTLKKLETSSETTDLSVMASVYSNENTPGTSYLEDMHQEHQSFHRDPSIQGSLRNGIACYQCHLSGPILLSSKIIHTSFPGDAETTLATINRVMKNHKSPHFSNEFIPMGFSLGTGPAQDLDFIKNKCLKGSFKEGEPEKLKKEMNCASCHDGKKQPRIYPPPIGQAFLLNHMILNGLMPPGKKNGTRSALTPEEISQNTQLANCLDLAATQAAIDWVTQVKCTGKAEMETLIQNVQDAQVHVHPEGSASDRELEKQHMDHKETGQHEPENAGSAN